MPYLNPSEQPQYSGQIPAHTTSTVVHPDSYHPVYQALLDNTAFLKGETDKLPGIQQQLNNIESTSAVDVNRAVQLDWQYRGHPYAIEFFSSTHTLLAHMGVAVVEGVQGDDSLDVAETSAIRLGADYLLVSADGIKSELVRTSAVLSSQRLRLTSELAHNWGPGDTLGGMSLQRANPLGAVGVAGSKWVSRTINLGNSIGTRAVVIRRTFNVGEARLLYRDAYNQDWKEAMWSLRRVGSALGDIPAGFADYEYLLPMRGDGTLRLEIEGEETITIHHIVGLGGPTGLGGYLNQALRPAVPTLSSPANAAINVLETPTLQLTGYSSPASNAFTSAKFQLSNSATFATLLHESPAVASMSYSVPEGILPVSNLVYWRAVVTDSAGLTSDQPSPQSFTTKATYAYVKTPYLTAPTNGQTELPDQPTLQSSAFAVKGGNDTHASSRWQIRLASSTWDAPVHDSGNLPGNLTSYIVPAGVLQQDKEYCARVLQTGTALSHSEWSQGTTFITREMFASIIGIVNVHLQQGAAAWQRIDHKFNALVTNSTTFNNNPVYSGIIDQTVDGQAMVKIPAFYVKKGLVPSGPYEGKRFWMVSDRPAAGFVLHPAFKNAGTSLAQFWIGKYQGTPDGSKLGSNAGLIPVAGTTSLDAMAQLRNVGGINGFSNWNIYQLGAIRLLCLLEAGTPDVKSVYGAGSQSVRLAGSNPSVSGAAWRGITGLWGNMVQKVEGFKYDGNQMRMQVWDLQGNKTWVNTGIVAPIVGGDVYDIDTRTGEGIGLDFDLGYLFVIKQTGSPNVFSSTYHPGHSWDYNYWHGILSSYGSGLFSSGTASFSADVVSNTHIGGRLAKI